MNGCFRLTMLFIVPLLCGGWFCVMSWFVLMDHTAWSVVDITPLAAVGGPAGRSARRAARHPGYAGLPWQPGPPARGLA